MRDLIVGSIKQVIVSDILQVVVTQVVRDNYHKYGPEERVRVRELKTESSGVLERIDSSPLRKAALRGRGVMCLVHSREAGDTIEAEVFILSGETSHSGGERARVYPEERADEIYLVEGGAPQ